MVHLSKLQLTLIQRMLDQSYAKVADLQLVMLASSDGFQLAVSGSKRGVPELAEKFSAMASAMCALSEAAGTELGASALDVVILDYEQLQVVLRTIKGESGDFVLATAASKETVLGNLLWSVRECAESIAALLH